LRRDDVCVNTSRPTLSRKQTAPVPIANGGASAQFASEESLNTSHSGLFFGTTKRRSVREKTPRAKEPEAPSVFDCGISTADVPDGVGCGSLRSNRAARTRESDDLPIAGETRLPLNLARGGRERSDTRNVEKLPQVLRLQEAG